MEKTIEDEKEADPGPTSQEISLHYPGVAIRIGLRLIEAVQMLQGLTVDILRGTRIVSLPETTGNP